MHVVKTLADIALCRRGPGDLPASVLLLGFVMALYIIQSALQVVVTSKGDGALSAGIADLCVTSALVVGLLAAVGRLSRAPQTLTALLGVEVLLAPAVIAILNIEEHQPPTATLGNLLRLVLLGVVVWDRLIAAHVLRLAVNSSLAVGVLLALFTAIAGYYLTGWLVPLAPSGGG